MIPAPGAHGGDGVRLAAALGIAPEAVLDLSQSLNPCAPAVAPFVARHLDAIRRYPDATASVAALAGCLAADPARLVLTNGGAEAIALVAAEYPVGRVDAPDFSLYVRHLRTLDPAGPRWRSNPNNPTGRLADPDERAAVWDEAFYPLATGRWTRGDLDAIVVGSLTKVFACPGLRIGYVLAPTADAAHRIRTRQPEWSVNALACAVLPELLAAADLPAWSATIAASRTALETLLVDHGCKPEPSDANYLLVRDVPGLRAHLARSAVLVRDTRSFGIPDGVRIAVPGADGLARLADTLKGYER